MIIAKTVKLIPANSVLKKNEADMCKRLAVIGIMALIRSKVKPKCCLELCFVMLTIKSMQERSAQKRV